MPMRRSHAAGQVRRHQSGFTLIELMIVVVVVAILASIAYPAYSDSVRKSRRGQAKADMVELAQMLERHHSEGNTYEGFNPGGLTHSPRTGTPRYTLNVVTTQTTFTVSAVPETGQDKDKCGTMGLDQTGKKSPADSECWQ